MSNENKSAINKPIPSNINVSEEPYKNTGWTKVTSKKHPSVVYYHNPSSGKRQWHEPGTNAVNHQGRLVPTTEFLPEGWKKYMNARNNVVPPLYWYENDKGVTHWQIPDELKPKANAAAKNVEKAKNAVQNAVANLKIKTPGASAGTNDVFKPVFDSLQTVKEELGDLEKQLTPKATSGGRRRRSTRKARKSRKTRSRRR